MTSYKITGKGYSGVFKGDENFFKAARRILLDNCVDIFQLKTVEQLTSALNENGYNVFKTLNQYDEAIEEAPHLVKYIREIEKEDAEDKIPASAQITKIKIGKNERTATIMYQKNGSKASKEVIYRGYEAAVDKFICDFREMSKHIIETLQFPEEWLDRMTTTGLSITWKDDMIMGMVITAQVEIQGLNAPFNLNTPFIELYSWHIGQENSCNDVYFSMDCEELLETILADAKRYMNGENADPVQQKIEGLN